MPERGLWRDNARDSPGFLLLSAWIWRIAQPDPADKATEPPGWTGGGRDKVLPVREAEPMLESD